MIWWACVLCASVAHVMLPRQSFAADSSSSPTTTQPAQPNQSPPVASRELLAHVQQQLRTIESVQADFVQEKHLAVLKHVLTIRGHFALQKPDKVIWIVNEPVRYAIRVQGEEVRQWDEDTNKVQVIHLGGDPTFKAITEQIQAWFLGNYQTLEQSYDVYLLNDKPLSLRFAPKPGSMVAKLVKSIDVTFGKDELNLDMMVVRETAGDSTTLNFVNTRLNQPIKPQTWEIPPK
jgi:outer membrane lipoprotein carrier protein